jgi:hypothetical protein
MVAIDPADAQARGTQDQVADAGRRGVDRCQDAREVIAREGLTTATRDGGLKTHPACRVERDARLAFARLMRALDLDNGSSGQTGLPVSGIDEQSAAMKRWPERWPA